METIRNESGKQFDAEIVEVFLQIESQFREIRDQYADVEEVEETFTNLDAAFPGNRKKSEQTLTIEQEQALLQVLPPNEASEYTQVPVETTTR